MGKLQRHVRKKYGSVIFLKIKDCYVMRSVAGSNVVLPTGNAAVDFNGMMTLNEVGALLWEKLAVGAEEDELVAAILESYNVSEEIARKDTAAFIAQMREADILE